MIDPYVLMKAQEDIIIVTVFTNILEALFVAYILYCDESSDKGIKYSDFFGGCIINSKDQFELTQTLQRKKDELNLTAEIKWTKVTENYLNKYIEMIDLFLT